MLFTRPTCRLTSLSALTLILCALAPAQAPPAPAAKLPTFAIASIRRSISLTDQFALRFTPDGVHIENASLLLIIRAAYGMFNSLDDKFIDVPAWAKTERFSIDAKVDPADADAFTKLDFNHRQQMVQALLADRCHFSAHTETRDQPIYALTIAKGGSKLTPAKPNDDPKAISLTASPGKIVATQAVIPQLVSQLTQALGRTVEDRTGLPAKYDFTLTWTPEDHTSDRSSNQSSDATAAPSLFTALQEQLGLKLSPSKAPVPVLVIDHLEQPTEN